jgi:hypothetical protein
MNTKRTAKFIATELSIAKESQESKVNFRRKRFKSEGNKFNTNGNNREVIIGFAEVIIASGSKDIIAT